MKNRKDYSPITDTKLDRMRATADGLRDADYGSMTIPAKTMFQILAELTDAREELFRLRLCETVEQIISNELDVEDEEDHLAFHWPLEPFLATDMHDSERVWKPAFPCRDTTRIPQPPEPPTSTEHEGRRLPKAE